MTLENTTNTRKLQSYDPIDYLNFNKAKGTYSITHTFALASYDNKSSTFTYLIEPGHHDIEQKKTLNQCLTTLLLVHTEYRYRIC